MAKTKTKQPKPTAADRLADDDLPGVAGGTTAPSPQADRPSGPQPPRPDPDPFDDAPPAGPDGKPIDRCKCGETAGDYRTIRETDRIRGLDPAGKPYKGIVWGVVVCDACGRRRPRKRFVEVVDEATGETGPAA